MRRVVVLPLLLLLLLSASACGEHQSTSSAEAARADSSAAGYAVGQRVEGARPASTSGADTNAGRATTAAVPNDTARRTGAATAGTVTMSNANPATTASAAAARPSTPPESSAKAAVRVDSANASGAGHRQLPPNGEKAVPRSDPATVPEVSAGPVRLNEFLTYDARSRTVSLQLIAGYNGLNGSLNYNGATNGSHGVMVPAGWRVHIAVTNRDSDLQHSAIVLRKVLPPPIEPSEPAFAGAALPKLDEGLQEDETGTLDFVVGRPGHFMIACGVPGHAQAGEWLELVVVKDSALPSYR